MENDQIYVSIYYNTSKNYRAAGKWNCLGGEKNNYNGSSYGGDIFCNSSCVPILSLVLAL